MLRIAAVFLREFLGIDTLSDPALIAMINDMVTQKDLIMDADQLIVSDFYSRLGDFFRTNAFTVAEKRRKMRIDPNSRTAVADGNRLRLSKEMLSEVPDRDFVALLHDVSGRVAGRLTRQQDAENGHMYVTGQSGTGKIFEACQLMAKKRAADEIETTAYNMSLSQ